MRELPTATRPGLPPRQRPAAAPRRRALRPTATARKVRWRQLELDVAERSSRGRTRVLPNARGQLSPIPQRQTRRRQRPATTARPGDASSPDGPRMPASILRGPEASGVADNDAGPISDRRPLMATSDGLERTIRHGVDRTPLDPLHHLPPSPSLIRLTACEPVAHCQMSNDIKPHRADGDLDADQYAGILRQRHNVFST